MESSIRSVRYTTQYILATPPDPNRTFPIRPQYCEDCDIPTDLCQYGPNANFCQRITIAPEGEAVAPLVRAGRGKNKKTVQSSPDPIHVRCEKRKGNKHVTVLKNLSAHGIDIDAARKYFAQHLSCGCSKGSDDEIIIQGDFCKKIVGIIVAKWNQIEESMVNVG
ncbi:hypothetical protein ACOME3_010475 [Neoechinorhynchus agilis]